MLGPLLARRCWRQHRRIFSITRRMFSDVKPYYEDRLGLEGTVKPLGCYIFLHSPEPPSTFPSVHHTALSRELLLRAAKWGGMINFSYTEGGGKLSAASDKQAATVFSQRGGRLDIPDVSLENLDDIEGRISNYLNGPVTKSTSATAHLYVCTHGARDCRCGERGQQVYDALVRAVRESTSSLAKNIEVSAVGHVGGHKYAANILVFPHGDWLGTVKPEDAPSIVAQLCEELYNGIKPLDSSARPFMLQNWRGRMWMTQEQQKDLYAAAITR